MANDSLDLVFCESFSPQKALLLLICYNMVFLPSYTHLQASDKAKELIGGLPDPKATGVMVEVLEVEGQSKVSRFIHYGYPQKI